MKRRREVNFVGLHHFILLFAYDYGVKDSIKEITVCIEIEIKSFQTKIKLFKKDTNYLSNNRKTQYRY